MEASGERSNSSRTCLLYYCTTLCVAHTPSVGSSSSMHRCWCSGRPYCIYCSAIRKESVMDNSNDSRTDAELHGEPYPRNGVEWDDYYEWERSLEET